MNLFSNWIWFFIFDTSGPVVPPPPSSVRISTLADTRVTTNGDTRVTAE
jgi:hypothetical protein